MPIIALMTLLSAGVSAGYSLEGLLGPGGGDSFARYAASRLEYGLVSWNAHVTWATA